MKRQQIEEIQASIMEETVALYEKKKSLRAVAAAMKFSMTKVRKILITAGRFESDVSRAVGDAFAAGMSAEEIAASLGMSLNNVYQYLPYRHVVYNMPVRSGAALRQERYRTRKKGDADALGAGGSRGKEGSGSACFLPRSRAITPGEDRPE